MKKILYWLGFVFGLILLLGFLLQQYGIDWYRSQMKPGVEFSAAAGQLQYGGRLNYQDEKFWAAFPGKQSPAQLIPKGVSNSNSKREVDVFYIHPTSYFYSDAWNAPLFEESWASEMIDTMLASQASVFNDCCRVYAPHYREATLWSFYSRGTTNGFKALDFAYSDVKQAFDYFVKNHLQGRPFVIASHSQGTAHAIRLLAEVVQGQKLQQQLVAVYAGGYWLPLDTFTRTLTDIEPCEESAQFGCLVHWSTYGEQGKLLNHTPHWYRTGWEWSDGKPLLCINPLSWKMNEIAVEKTQHLGALPVTTEGSFLNILFNWPTGFQRSALGSPQPEWTSAQCRKGLLYVQPQLQGPFSDGGLNVSQDYHLYDYNLFYMNIRSNVKERVEAFLNSKNDNSVVDSNVLMIKGRSVVEHPVVVGE
jgi:hypothetical protein